MSDKFTYQLWIENSEWDYKCVDDTPRNPDGLTEEQVQALQILMSIEVVVKRHNSFARVKAAFPATFTPAPADKVERWERTGEHRIPVAGETFECMVTGCPQLLGGGKFNKPRWILQKVGE